MQNDIAKPKRGKQPTDHTGKRFDRLVVLSYAGRRVTDAKRNCGAALWLCRCDCGNEKVILAPSLVDGTTRSCGCLRKEMLKDFNGRAGKNALAEGESAFNQLFYAYNKSARERGHYFGLTKEVFRELTQQDCFYCGSPPTVKFHAAKGTRGDFIGNGIDRVDNTQGYTPENVRACCKQCNIAKGVLTEADFFAWIKRVASRLSEES